MIVKLMSFGRTRLRQGHSLAFVRNGMALISHCDIFQSLSCCMRNSMDDNQALTDADYQALASFRYALRQFTTFSESKATEAGLTPRQHQALLAIRAAHEPATVGFVAARLIMKPHSANGLIDRLEDRQSVLEGKTESVRVDLGGTR